MKATVERATKLQKRKEHSVIIIPTNSEQIAPKPIFMTADNVARDYCIPKATLAKWRWNSTGPDYAKLGAKVLYRKADIDRWIEANTRTSAASNDNEVAK